MFRHDGSLLWDKDLGDPGPQAPGRLIPAVGDVNGDGTREIFASFRRYDLRPDQIYGFDRNGTRLTGWPATAPIGTHEALSLADLDRDGKRELLAMTEGIRHTGGNSFAHSLFVFSHDGRMLSEIRFPYDPVSFRAPPPRPVFPEVGNLDADGELEIVTPYGEGIAAWNRDGTLVWARMIGGHAFGSPAVGDVDGDGYHDVVVGRGISRFDSSPVGGIFVLGRNGQVKDGWPALRDVGFSTSPALGDVDGDGRLEICVAQGPSVWLLNSRGEVLPGWPQQTNPLADTLTCPVLADVTGDGKPDVVTGAGGIQPELVSSGDVSTSGGVYAWNADGSPIDLNGELPGHNLFTESRVMAPPVVTDVNGDRMTDVVASSAAEVAWDPEEEELGRSKERTSVYVWGLGVPYIRENHAPVLQLQPSGDQTVQAGGRVSIRLSATDEDGGPLTYTAVEKPDGSFFYPVSNGAIFGWNVGRDVLPGTYPATFKVEDPEGASDSETVSIHVVSPPPPPPPAPGITGFRVEPLGAWTWARASASVQDPRSRPMTYVLSMGDGRVLRGTVGMNGLVNIRQYQYLWRYWRSWVAATLTVTTDDGREAAATFRYYVW